jgi:hypothetical protein
MSRRKFVLFVVLPVGVLLALGTVGAVGEGGPLDFGGGSDSEPETTTTTSPPVVTSSPEPPTTVQPAIPTPDSPHDEKNGYAVVPRHDVTPGAIDGDVTQGNIQRTICDDSWVDGRMPPPSYTTPTKTKQIAVYGYSTYAIENFELDHLVPVGLGGDPTALANLWPQPWESREAKLVPRGWGAETKNELEASLRQAVCSGRTSLQEAQTAIAGDWVAVANRYGIKAGEQAG